jgi:Uma2 family endonuclease
MVTTPSSIFYPESDGLPMADNTRQFESIVYVKKGVDWLFSPDPNVFIAGDLLWYPVEGNPKLRQAPDVMIVFGRPKGDRGSYQQWREENIPPQVVFEILSPGNTIPEMIRRFQFYERYGVEEYYIYDPDNANFDGYLRQGIFLEPIETMQDWISSRLGTKFRLSSEGKLELFQPDEQPFETYEQLAERAEQAEAEIQRLREQLRSLGQDPDQR